MALGWHVHNNSEQCDHRFCPAACTECMLGFWPLTDDVLRILASKGSLRSADLIHHRAKGKYITGWRPVGWRLHDLWRSECQRIPAGHGQRRACAGKSTPAPQTLHLLLGFCMILGAVNASAVLQCAETCAGQSAAAQCAARTAITDWAHKQSHMHTHPRDSRDASSPRFGMP